MTERSTIYILRMMIKSFVLTMYFYVKINWEVFKVLSICMFLHSAHSKFITQDRSYKYYSSWVLWQKSDKNFTGEKLSECSKLYLGLLWTNSLGVFDLSIKDQIFTRRRQCSSCSRALKQRNNIAIALHLNVWNNQPLPTRSAADLFLWEEVKESLLKIYFEKYKRAKRIVSIS